MRTRVSQEPPQLIASAMSKHRYTIYLLVLTAIFCSCASLNGDWQKHDIISCYSAFQKKPTKKRLFMLLTACTESTDCSALSLFHKELTEQKRALLTVDGEILTNFDVAVACMSALSGKEIPEFRVKCIISGNRFENFYRYHIRDIDEGDIEGVRESFLINNVTCP